MVGSGTLITVTIAICAAFVSAMGILAVILNTRIGDVREEVRDVRRVLEAIEVRLDGIGETLARFDERLRRLEAKA